MMLLTMLMKSFFVAILLPSQIVCVSLRRCPPFHYPRYHVACLKTLQTGYPKVQTTKLSTTISITSLATTTGQAATATRTAATTVYPATRYTTTQATSSSVPRQITTAVSSIPKSTTTTAYTITQAKTTSITNSTTTAAPSAPGVTTAVLPSTNARTDLNTTMLVSTTPRQIAISTNIPNGCPSPSYPSTHTACLNRSPNAVNPRGVGAVTQSWIVDYHNYLRRLQAATDMQLMVWDDEVALIAQKWSDNCDYRHDTERYVPGKYSAGQNIAYGFRTWNDTILAWYNEISQFTYGSSNNNFGSVGHYTQMVWNSTAKIGCGATTCTNLGAMFYVCNYAPAGNMLSQIATPYTYGSRCAACPGRCNDGLCDCGGVVCKNGGTLNLSTCQCTCQSPYGGLPDCNLNCTGVVDKPYCGTQWPRSFCSLYYNVPYDCPRMCSVCPAI